ncbi:1-hydroxycarotenoid 3,4-desaturase CrtD [Saccharicrinis sp. FJH62]|uniref:1-hydroxycarotenoid 3,4-desaturase CrtD n=1 Tax=Saccharicrinis sp. FJH62 TaxID=3344657 RepID=UPI0035D45BA6
MQKALVIGGGIGGLAVALRLKKAGLDVELFEKNSTIGGKMGEIRSKEFRFDTGPSLFTLPELSDELFELFGKNPRDYFSYTKLENSCRYIFQDGTVVNAWADTDRFKNEVHNVLNEPEENLTTYLERYRKLFKTASPVFLFNAFQRWKNFTKKEFRGMLFHLHELDSIKTMHTRNKKAFNSPKLVQIFDRYATYNGSDPFRAPATLNMIAHLEHNLGAYFPDRGIRSIALSLEKLAIEVGVRIHTNTPVEKILTEGKSVSGIVCKDQKVDADIIVSDADVRTVYMNMFEGIRPPKSIINKELSSSALIFYWGVDFESNLDVHNILFAEDYKAEFKAIFKDKTLYHDPTVYIFISKKVVNDDAPQGCENWFVMINVPANQNHNWDQLREDARTMIQKKINKLLHVNISEHIVTENIADPVTIERNTSSFRGALYGNSSNSMFAAFNRHANFSTQFQNLWFTGGSVHPGGGIPLCIASAKIVASEVETYFINQSI